MSQGPPLILGLYRSVLRLHRQFLPPQLRDLGDSYARAEFQAHLKSKNTTREQWEQFYQAWRGYLLTLGGSDTQPRVGDLDEGLSQALATESLTFSAEHLDQFLTPEQKLRMESLRKEAQLGGDVKEKVRQELEGEGSMLAQLRQQQENAERHQ